MGKYFKQSIFFLSVILPFIIPLQITAEMDIPPPSASFDQLKEYDVIVVGRWDETDFQKQAAKEVIHEIKLRVVRVLKGKPPDTITIRFEDRFTITKNVDPWGFPPRAELQGQPDKYPICCQAQVVNPGPRVPVPEIKDARRNAIYFIPSLDKNIGTISKLNEVQAVELADGWAQILSDKKPELFYQLIHPLNRKMEYQALEEMHGKWDEKIHQRLLNASLNPDSDVRIDARHILFALDDDHVVEAVLNRIKNHPEIAWRNAWGLAISLGDEQARPAARLVATELANEPNLSTEKKIALLERLYQGDYEQPGIDRIAHYIKLLDDSNPEIQTYVEEEIVRRCWRRCGTLPEGKEKAIKGHKRQKRYPENTLSELSQGVIEKIGNKEWAKIIQKYTWLPTLFKLDPKATNIRKPPVEKQEAYSDEDIRLLVTGLSHQGWDTRTNSIKSLLRAVRIDKKRVLNVYKEVAPRDTIEHSILHCALGDRKAFDTMLEYIRMIGRVGVSMKACLESIALSGQLEDEIWRVLNQFLNSTDGFVTEFTVRYLFKEGNPSWIEAAGFNLGDLFFLDEQGRPQVRHRLIRERLKQGFEKDEDTFMEVFAQTYVLYPDPEATSILVNYYRKILKTKGPSWASSCLPHEIVNGIIHCSLDKGREILAEMLGHEDPGWAYRAVYNLERILGLPAPGPIRWRADRIKTAEEFLKDTAWLKGKKLLDWRIAVLKEHGVNIDLPITETDVLTLIDKLPHHKYDSTLHRYSHTDAISLNVKGVLGDVFGIKGLRLLEDIYDLPHNLRTKYLTQLMEIHGLTADVK